MAYTTFWPGDARLAITISIMFEANGQPISGAGGPITEPIKPGYPDLATNTYFDYGMREGIPRLLDLFDRRKFRVNAFTIGQAVDKNPQLAREIAERGHEVAALGRTWEPQYALSREIAHWALQTPEVTLWVECEKPEISGMPAGHISMKV